METTPGGPTQAAPDYSPNGTAHTWRPPQVREFGPEEGAKERAGSETKPLLTKLNGRQEVVFLHAKDLANAIATKLGGGVRAAGKGWRCRCPAHADNEPSLHLEDGKSGLVLASCFPCGNDEASQIKLLAAIADLGYALSPTRDDFVSADTSRPKKKIDAVYDYVDALGKVAFQVIRKKPKEFSQRRPDGNGGWIWDTKGCPVLPYRLPKVLEAVAAGSIVFVVEGEKDVETAFAIGLVATCNARGAGKWADEHSEYLRGADAVLIPDNDDPGRSHVAAVAKSLWEKALRIRIVELPGLEPKGDLSSWITSGHTGEELMRLCDAAKPYDGDLATPSAPTNMSVGTFSSDLPARPEKSDAGARRTQATALIEIATGEDVELFHAPDGTAFADIQMRGHRETHSLKGNGFRRWLKRAYYMATGGAPNSDAMATAMGVIEARAHYDGEERKVHLRLAEHQGKIYLDLCDPTWAAIEIDVDGWRKVETPPVRFRRTPGMLPIPDPVRDGRIDELRKHLHVDDDTFVLIVSWLLAILRGRGPYPILAFTGEQGTGKSLTAEKIRSLLDPHTAPLRSLPRDTRDLFVAAINGHVLVFDNLSGISAEISDCLCRLSTGGGFSTRALYTDGDEVLFDGQRPVALTSIADVASRSDLADRLLMARLEVIPDNERRPEGELRAAFETARPRILGALLDVVVHGLEQFPNTRLNRLPRMADYAIWMRACETAIWSAGMHMAAYEANRGDAVDTVLDADPVAMVLRQHMEVRREYTGTASELLNALSGLVPEHIRRGRQWPGSPKGLSGQLTRLAPALRRVGLAISSDREGHTGRRLIHIVKDLEAAQ